MDMIKINNAISSNLSLILSEKINLLKTKQKHSQKSFEINEIALIIKIVKEILVIVYGSIIFQKSFIFIINHYCKPL